MTERRRSPRVRPDTPSPAVAVMRDATRPGAALALQVLDVSLGGCALRLPDAAQAPPPGVPLTGVRLVLDAHTRLVLTLEVLHVSWLSGEAEDDGAGTGLRLGCRFVALEAPARAALQRWLQRQQARQAAAGVPCS